MLDKLVTICYIRGMNMQKQQAKVVKDLIAYYKQPTKKLISFLIKEGYTKTKVASVLGVDRSAINHVYEL